MSKYVIMTDACCDLSDDTAQKYGIISFPMSVTIDGADYVCNINGSGLTSDKFYELLVASESAMTSAVNTSTITEYMECELQGGNDILYIAFSSALSATHSNGNFAAKELQGKYPERKIKVIDSRCASLGEGLLVYLAALEKERGLSLEELYSYIERIKYDICHWFTVDDLAYLKRGGRISKTTALLGSLLNIKPILMVDNGGHLIPHSKVRGVKNAIKALADRMAETIRDAAGQTVFISHANAIEKARELAAMITERFPGIKEIKINSIGPTIGCHAGPGTVALFFKGKMPA
jgi:DegV family protein with EDD domain